jgi:mono/diheme cytochrome c family protein
MRTLLKSLQALRGRSYPPTREETKVRQNPGNSGRHTVAALFWLAAGLALAATGCTKPGPPPPVDSPAYYTQVVQPILRENCYRCHASMNHKGDLRLDSAEAILRGGKRGADVIPGHPESSLLITLIRHEQKSDPPGPMPPKSKLSEAEIAAVTAWIRAGAKMPPAE